jgi:phospholipase C
VGKNRSPGRSSGLPSSAQSFDPSRRRLLTGMAAAGATGLVACSGGGTVPPTLPPPADSGIEHVIVVMMENRSFDHMFGWLTTADAQQNQTFKDKNGQTQSTFHLASDPAYGYQGCGRSDPKHDYKSAHADYNNGAMDGFLQDQPAGDLFPVGYYNEADVPFFSACSRNFTICDAYHSGILDMTFPNRMYMHTGQTDRLSNTLKISTLPTIWDSLLAKGISGRYYYADTPILALFQNAKEYKKQGVIQKLSQFAKDFGPGGTPPSVAYVDPYFGLMIGELLGTSWDDHAYADIRDGQCFMNYIYNILRNSPVWDKTVLIYNYDEFGGFFDHVPPPLGPVSDAEKALPNDGRLGIRTPCIVAGPFGRAKAGRVVNTQVDPNSILNMICWRWGMDPLGVRGSSSTNFAHVLQFGGSLDASAPDFTSFFDNSYGSMGMKSTGPFPTNAPFTPPKAGDSGTFGGKCSAAASTSPEAWRQYEQHYAEVRAVQELGRQIGLDVDPFSD